MDNRQDSESFVSSCGQINNVLFYFGNLSPVLKIRLIKMLSCSLYGSVLWDMDMINRSFEYRCIVLYSWPKGLRRVSRCVGYSIHTKRTAIFCHFSVMYDEQICKRRANFINICLNAMQLCTKESTYLLIAYSYRTNGFPVGKKCTNICCQRYDVYIIKKIAVLMFDNGVRVMFLKN